MDLTRLCRYALPAAAVVAAIYLVFKLLTGAGDVTWGPKLGVEFTYSRDYHKKEQRLELDHYQIVLIRPEKFVPSAVPREAPPALTIDIFAVKPPPSLEAWLKTERRSNANLQVGTFSLTKAGGQQAVQYIWDGLYRGESTAVYYGGRVYIFSVTYLDAKDRIRADYFRLLRTVKFLTSP
jgi:hypothetical protein